MTSWAVTDRTRAPTKNITVMVSLKDFNELDRRAKVLGINRVDVIRRAIREYLEKEEATTW